KPTRRRRTSRRPRLLRRPPGPHHPAHNTQLHGQRSGEVPVSNRRSSLKVVLMVVFATVSVTSVLVKSALLPALASPNLQEKLYQSCTDERGITPTPTTESVQSTTAVSVTATPGATAVAVTSAASDDLTFYKIVGKESEACYQVGEVFIDEDNRFNLAV